jgi:hypothetical protein
MAKKPVPTTSIIQASVFMSPKYILNKDDTLEKVEPLELVDTTTKDVGGRNKTKLVFWFEDTPEYKKTILAFNNDKILVAASVFMSKYNDIRDMTLNKGYAINQSQQTPTA